MSGYPINGLNLKLRNGMNNQSGSIIKTGSTNENGYYYFNSVPAGNYTVESLSAGYTTTYFSVISIGGQTTSGQDASITPELGSDEVRIILTWGEYPYDLDSHLTGPGLDGSRFHIYFYDQIYSYSGTTYAELDLDDTSSWGPETCTIYHQENGLYRYSVHDYSNRETGYNKSLSNSGAQVRIYKGSELLQAFYVPENTEGTLWTVFEMFNNTIVPKNIMSYETYPLSITKLISHETDAHLMKNLPQKQKP